MKHQLSCRWVDLSNAKVKSTEDHGIDHADIAFNREKYILKHVFFEVTKQENDENGEM